MKNYGKLILGIGLIAGSLAQAQCQILNSSGQALTDSDFTWRQVGNTSGTYNNYVRVTVTASDCSGLASIQLSGDGGPWTEEVHTDNSRGPYSYSAVRYRNYEHSLISGNCTRSGGNYQCSASVFNNDTATYSVKLTAFDSSRHSLAESGTYSVRP
jgi:hypothetical protein